MDKAKIIKLIGNGKTQSALELIGNAEFLSRLKAINKKARLGLIGWQAESELTNNLIHEVLLFIEK